MIRRIRNILIEAISLGSFLAALLIALLLKAQGA